MKNDKFIQAAMIAVFCLFVLTALATLSKEANAGVTDCEEWASMTQVLVLRWQGNNLPKADGTQATSDDVKAELKRTMGHHPELETALEFVDFAWAGRKQNPVHVWQAARDYCEFRKKEAPVKGDF